MATEPRHLVPERLSDYTVYEEFVVDDEGARDEGAVSFFHLVLSHLLDRSLK